MPRAALHVKYFFRVVLHRWRAGAPATTEARKCRVDLDASRFPVPYLQMLGLWGKCVAPIMCSGDHSITDAWFCAQAVPICYQVADWKQDFGKALATYAGCEAVRLGRRKQMIDLVVLPRTRPTPPSAEPDVMRRVAEELQRR